MLKMKEKKKLHKKYFRCFLSWILSMTMMLSGFPAVSKTIESSGKARAIQWLIDVAEEDNEWKDGGLPNLTCDVMAVLREEGTSCESDYLDWWEIENADRELNVDELAHLAWGRQEQEYLDSLREMQNEDGGFGLTDQYTSDVYDTMLVLYAECSVSGGLVPDNTKDIDAEKRDREWIQSAAEYLWKEQRADGGFGYTTANDSDPGLSAKIGLALLIAGVEAEDCYKKLDEFCLHAFRGDFAADSFLEQAELARYLYRREKISSADAIEQNLHQVQRENGSVHDNIRDTIQYILLLHEIEDYHSLKLKINSMETEADTYVLEASSTQQLTLNTIIQYTINQEIEASVRYVWLENGVIHNTESMTCTISSDQTEQMVHAVMDVTAEADKDYVLRTELLLLDENGSESVYTSTECAFTVHQTEKQELVLQETTSSGDGYGVDLSWNDISNADNRYGYRVYRKQGDGEWETRSTWDGEETVRILNIYPCADACNYLVDWMEETVNDSVDPAGMGLFDIDAVYIKDYNADPEKYLMDSQGNYRYDVLMFGTYDSNDYQDINDVAYEATQAFLDTGRGVLFGHDTIVSWMSNFSKFAEQIGTKLKPSYTRRDTTKVKVVKQGFLTNYPWKLSGMLTIPTTHTQAQYTGGTLSADVWMELGSGYDIDQETGGMTNAYLFTKNQMAMIQTGHSNGQATDDERKVIANTLFYLKQLTNKTNVHDNSFYDEAAPQITEVSDISSDHQITIQSEDRGTTYQYYVEAVNAGKRDEEGILSNTVSATACSGIKGFIIGISDSKEEMEGLLTYDADGNLISEVLPAEEGCLDYTVADLKPGQSAVLHIYAVDYAGNISEEKVVEITAPKADINYLDQPYALFASDRSVTINCYTAEIHQDIYAKEDFCFGGSILNASGKVNTTGKIAAYGWMVDIGEKIEQAEEKQLDDFSEDMISDMKNSHQGYDELELYESTSILKPTFCSGTTGAYCTNLLIQDSLISQGSISINCKEADIGTEDKKSVLCSLDGDITINATKANAYGLIYAPNGTVSVNASEFNLIGTIIAKEIKLSGTYIRINQ